MSELQKKRDGARKYRYGLTPEQYASLSDAQGGKCAICGAAPVEMYSRPGARKRPCHLYVDHDHETGAVRGLVCNQCNMGLGSFRSNPAFLSAAIEYLAKPATFSTARRREPSLRQFVTAQLRKEALRKTVEVEESPDGRFAFSGGFQQGKCLLPGVGVLSTGAD